MPPSTPSSTFFDRLFPRRRGKATKAASGSWAAASDGGGGGGGPAVAQRQAFASAPAEPVQATATARAPSAPARPASAPGRPAAPSTRPKPRSTAKSDGAWRVPAAVAGAFVAGAAAAIASGRAPRPGSAGQAAAAASPAKPPPPPPKPPKESAPLLALPRSIPPRGHEDHTFVRRGGLVGFLRPGWDLVERRVSADALPLPPPPKDPKSASLKARLPAAVGAAGGWTARQAADKVRRAVADAGDRLAGDSVSKVGSAVKKPISAAGKAVVGVLPKSLRRQAKDAVRGM